MYGSIGKLGITKIECATNQAIAFCHPDPELITLEYLFFNLKLLKPTLVALGQGGTQQNISQTLLKQVEFLLPPLNEQRRIVEKIETLFARLDQGEAALRHTQTLLARYRQSVLKAAVTGALTADWRAQKRPPPRTRPRPARPHPANPPRNLARPRQIQRTRRPRH